MKLGFWSGQRKSTLWCFWFYFSKALKAIISCCWIPWLWCLAALFLVYSSSVREEVWSRQGLHILSWVLPGDSWDFDLKTMFMLLGHAGLRNSVRQATLDEGWWWPGLGEHCEPSKVPPPLQICVGCELEGHTMKLWIVPFHLHGGMMDSWGSEHRKWVDRQCKWWSSLRPSSPSPHSCVCIPNPEQDLWGFFKYVFKSLSDMENKIWGFLSKPHLLKSSN